MKSTKDLKDSSNKEKKNSESIKLKKYNIKIIYYLILYFIINISKEENKIFLQINGGGNQNVFAESFEISETESYQIFVNNDPTPHTGKILSSLVNQINNITIKFDSPISSCKDMFLNLSNIIYVDLTNFDASNIDNMEKMFCECSSLASIDLTGIDTSQVESMNYIFYGCSSLESIDLSSLNTTKVRSMSYMFFGCSSLNSINLNNINTSNVEYMDYMFSECNGLASINLDNFDTSKVTTMESMFSGCSSLNSINLDNFDTSKVTSMESMFSECSSLNSLNLHRFDTSNVELMDYMFSGCSHLQSLILDNFVTLKVEFMDYMFSGCSALQSLNLNSFRTLRVEWMIGMFYECSSLSFLDLSNFDTSKVTNMSEMFSGCNSLQSLNLNNFRTPKVLDISNMFYGCNSLLSLDLYNFDTSRVTNMANMFNGCNALRSLNIINFSTSKVENVEDMFTGCNPIVCFNEMKAEKITSLLEDFTKIHKIIIANNKCIDDCSHDSTYSYEYNNICYENCPDGTRTTPENQYLCGEYTDVPTEAPTIITEKMSDFTENILETYNTDDTTYYEYIRTCNSIELFNNECELVYNNKILKDDIEKIIKEDIINGTLNDLINEYVSNQREDLIINYNNIKYEIITTNKYNNEEKDISFIELGECEYILKQNNGELVIFKIDIYKEGLLIPIVEYEIYDLNNKKKLDLNICKDKKIELLLPCNIDENEEFKYNISSEYFHDICFSYTTTFGTDITISDRRNEYIDNKMSLCENNCIYMGYNSDIKKSMCECEIKENLSLISEIEKRNDKLLNIFTNIENFANLNIMKCYEELLTKEGLINNVGNYIILSIIIINLICLMIFIKKDIKTIYKIITNIKNKNLRVETPPNFNLINELKKMYRKNEKKLYQNNPTKKDKKKDTFDMNLININKGNKSDKLELVNALMKKKELIINNQTYEYNINNDCELNSLPYKDALKHDKRSYKEYYISLLKRKQIIMFIFSANNEYNSKSIKISIFFLSLALCYSINAFFFESTIHNIYIDKGEYSFLYQISNVIFSILISNFIRSLLECLGLSEKNIIEIKYCKKMKMLKRKRQHIKTKFILYFIFSFMLLLFFWYYMSCFYLVYKNSHIHLIKTAIITFVISLLYPFATCLIPGIIRIPSLSPYRRNKKRLYIFSQFIETIILFFF